MTSRGEALFETHCAGCHSAGTADRASFVFRKYPRLDCDEYLSTTTDAYLFKVISQGGAAVGLDSTMRPFNGQLSQTEIADLIAFMRQLRANETRRE